MSWLLLLLVLRAALATPAPDPAGPPPALPPPPTAAEAARLAAGEVLLASRPAGGRALAEEVGRGIIDAAPQRVFAAVVDFAHYQEWVPFVKRSDALPRNDGAIVSFQSLELPFPLGKRYYKILARSDVSGLGDARTWRAWWRYLPGTGNVADHHGWWVLVPYGAGRTLGTCVLYTDPGNGMPAWAVHRGTAATMPFVFSALRQQIHRSRYEQTLIN
ncbi:MAG TPA: SRPBCC family protein [Thermoanaerobaculia bacterium]|nr:SRPBCC family protein [Thermoanaerobaculia bacterium]